MEKNVSFYRENCTFALQYVNTKVCHGYYSLVSPENGSDRLVIKGKFEIVTAIIHQEY